MFDRGRITAFTKKQNPDAWAAALDALDMGLQEFVYSGVVFHILDRYGEYIKVQQVRRENER